ncbi:MAG TPA: MmcQ/YjbR family DNA-binding protein [Acidimicrobiales bacterium]|nr:MmcQ/YjbR family DNA-binding protein [Acidimicrobiales bacterium]
MAGRSSTKAVLERLRRICLALPEAEEKPFGGHTAPAFRVRDKLFVMTSEDGTTMNCKGAPGAQEALVGSDPDRFFVPRYTGKNGWIGIRLDVEQDWDEIAELVEESWRRTAPKRLVAQLDSDPEVRGRAGRG